MAAGQLAGEIDITGTVLGRDVLFLEARHRL